MKKLPPARKHQPGKGSFQGVQSDSSVLSAPLTLTANFLVPNRRSKILKL